MDLPPELRTSDMAELLQRQAGLISAAQLGDAGLDPRFARRWLRVFMLLALVSSNHCRNSSIVFPPKSPNDTLSAVNPFSDSMNSNRRAKVYW